MKIINAQHQEYPDVTTEKKMRRIVRDKEELALSDGSKTFAATLINPTKSKQVTFNLLKEGDGVKFFWLDKVFYDRNDVYPLLKDILQLDK